MMLVDKETGKGYVEMEKVHHDKKEYASKGVAGTALGLGIAGVKEYSGMSIGNGKIAIGIPGTDKSIVLEANDIETFKQSLVK